MDEFAAPDPHDAAPAFECLPLRGLAATIVCGAVALFVLREAAALVTPILVSILAAYALESVVEIGMRCRLPRAAAVVVTYALVATVITGGARLAKRQVVAFLEDLPATIAALESAVFGRDATRRPQAAHNDAIQSLQRAATNIEATVNAVAPAAHSGLRLTIDEPFDVRTYLIDAWNRVVNTGAQMIVIAVLTFVLLLGGDRIKWKLIKMAGPRFEERILTIDVLRAIDRQIQRYLVARLGISSIVAGATAAAMWGVGVRQPVVLGAITGVLNVLPFVGPAFGVAVCAVVAFVQFHTAAATLLAGGAATLVAALEGNLITPWLTGRAGELNTVAVYVSILFWGWMWEMWGLLLAVPLMIAIKAAADHIAPLQPLGELLGR